jgi:hypothetical protein
LGTDDSGIFAVFYYDLARSSLVWLYLPANGLDGDIYVGGASGGG